MKTSASIFRIVAVVALVVLILAIFKQPYWYYQCVHWIICGIGVACAVFAHNTRQTAFTWLFGVVAVLFNPILPFYFHRPVWQIVDLLAALVFAASLGLWRHSAP